MTTDSEDLEELHIAAEKIGMKRKWFQSAPPASIPHYDLVESRRKRAVALGAIELDREGFMNQMKLWRSRLR